MMGLSAGLSIQIAELALEYLRVLVWPILIAFVFWKLRASIRSLIQKVADRISSGSGLHLTAGAVSLELAEFTAHEAAGPQGPEELGREEHGVSSPFGPDSDSADDAVEPPAMEDSSPAAAVVGQWTQRALAQHVINFDKVQIMANLEPIRGARGAYIALQAQLRAFLLEEGLDIASGMTLRELARTMEATKAITGRQFARIAEAEDLFDKIALLQRADVSAAVFQSQVQLYVDAMRSMALTLPAPTELPHVFGLSELA